MVDNETLTPQQAAEILKLKPDTIVRMIRSGRLPGIMVGNGTKRHRWLLRRLDVMAYIEDNRFQPGKDIQPAPRPRIQRAGYPMIEKYRTRLGI